MSALGEAAFGLITGPSDSAERRDRRPKRPRLSSSDKACGGGGGQGGMRARLEAVLAQPQRLPEMSPADRQLFGPIDTPHAAASAAAAADCFPPNARAHEGNLFAGVTVYFQGYVDALSPLHLRKLLEANGAKISATLSSSVTHVIARNLSGSATEKALHQTPRQHHAFIVKPEWINESLQAKRRRPEHSFEVLRGQTVAKGSAKPLEAFFAAGSSLTPTGSSHRSVSAGSRRTPTTPGFAAFDENASAVAAVEKSAATVARTPALQPAELFRGAPAAELFPKAHVKTVFKA